LATRSPRRGASRSASSKPRSGAKSGLSPEGAATADHDEIVARAARLGITADRVLQAYAHIAFADLRHIVEWTAEQGLIIKPLEKLNDDDVAAISEIVPGIGSGHPRIKLYDKKAALDAIARHLGMFPLPPRRHEDDAPEAEEEDPREFLARELDRLAAEALEK
jgi:phage terminase small subunit